MSTLLRCFVSMGPCKVMQKLKTYDLFSIAEFTLIKPKLIRIRKLKGFSLT